MALGGYELQFTNLLIKALDADTLGCRDIGDTTDKNLRGLYVIGSNRLQSDLVSELTADAGIDVDGVPNKDGKVDGVDVSTLPSIINSLVKVQSNENFGAGAPYEITNLKYEGGCFTTAKYAFKLKNVAAVLKRDAGTEGNIHLELKLADGAHKPTGGVLASATVPKTALTTDHTWVVFTFDTPYTIAAAIEYCLYWYADTGSAWYALDGDAAVAPEVGRVNSGDSGATWSLTTTDSFAYIFMGEM